MTDVDDGRYPIGNFIPVGASLTASERRPLIAAIEQAPKDLRRLTQGLSDRQLETPYRDGGWTIRQVVHHVPDSHMNAYVRMKLAATEDAPAISTYEEQLWAELADVREAPIRISLDLLDALHYRWVLFLRSLDDAAFERGYRHPQLGLMRLYNAVALYAWHGRHHVAHVERALAVRSTRI